MSDERLKKLESVVTHNAKSASHAVESLRAATEAVTDLCIKNNLLLDALMRHLGVDADAVMALASELLAEATAEAEAQSAPEPTPEPRAELDFSQVMLPGKEMSHDSRAFVFGGDK
jgi:hypothetical protein